MKRERERERERAGEGRREKVRERRKREREKVKESGKENERCLSKKAWNGDKGSSLLYFFCFLSLSLSISSFLMRKSPQASSPHLYVSSLTSSFLPVRNVHKEKNFPDSSVLRDRIKCCKRKGVTHSLTHIFTLTKRRSRTDVAFSTFPFPSSYFK